MNASTSQPLARESAAQPPRTASENESPSDRGPNTQPESLHTALGTLATALATVVLVVGATNAAQLVAASHPHGSGIVLCVTGETDNYGSYAERAEICVRELVLLNEASWQAALLQDRDQVLWTEEPGVSDRGKLSEVPRTRDSSQWTLNDQPGLSLHPATLLRDLNLILVYDMCRGSTERTNGFESWIRAIAQWADECSRVGAGYSIVLDGAVEQHPQSVAHILHGIGEVRNRAAKPVLYLASHDDGFQAGFADRVLEEVKERSGLKRLDWRGDHCTQEGPNALVWHPPFQFGPQPTDVITASKGYVDANYLGDAEVGAACRKVIRIASYGPAGPCPQYANQPVIVMFDLWPSTGVDFGARYAGSEEIEVSVGWRENISLAPTPTWYVSPVGAETLAEPAAGARQVQTDHLTPRWQVGSGFPEQNGSKKHFSLPPELNSAAVAGLALWMERGGMQGPMPTVVIQRPDLPAP